MRGPRTCRSGNFRIPGEVRKALIREGYTQSEIYGLKNKATWRQLREKCAEHWRQTVDTESAFEAALHVQRNDVVLETALRRLHQWTCLEALGAMAFNTSPCWPWSR